MSRIQAKNMFQEKENSVIKQHPLNSKYADTLPAKNNTLFPRKMYDSYQYQAHLERTADFLLPGESIWWETDKITGSATFYDGDNSLNTRPEGPHFIIFAHVPLKKK